jgi:hypothetical protein
MQPADAVHLRCRPATHRFIHLHMRLIAAVPLLLLCLLLLPAHQISIAEPDCTATSGGLQLLVRWQSMRVLLRWACWIACHAGCCCAILLRAQLHGLLSRLPLARHGAALAGRQVPLQGSLLHLRRRSGRGACRCLLVVRLHHCTRRTQQMFAYAQQM